MSIRLVHAICLVGVAVTAAAAAVWSYHTWVFVDNFDAVVPGRLYRSSQPRFDDYAKLRRYGIVRIINLRGLDEGVEDRRGQDEALRGANVEVINIPITRKVPVAEQIDAFFRAVDSAPGPVLMYCHHGEDRTGILGAAWRVGRQGWPIEKALHEMARHRCRIDGAKLAAVRDLLTSLRPEAHPFQPDEGADP